MVVFPFFMHLFSVCRQLFSRAKVQITAFEVTCFDPFVAVTLLFDCRHIEAWVHFLDMLREYVYDFPAFKIFAAGIGKEGWCARGRVYWVLEVGEDWP